MNKSGLILLVEDDLDILDVNQRVLVRDGHSVMAATTLAMAREHLMASPPDVVVLDNLLPDGSGLDFIPELREVSVAPVLFLIEEDKPEERLAGLAAGGNDCIAKPYDITEFRFRVNNFITLLYDIQDHMANLTFGPLRLDMLAQQAYISDEDMGLTPKEFALLHLFIKNENQIMSAEYLYEKIWGQPLNGKTNPVKIAVSRLRTKLEEREFIISAYRGAGYCFYRE